MKAVVYKNYGGPEVIRMADIPKPWFRHDEVLIEVHATTVSSADARLRALRMPRGFGLISRLVFGIQAPRQQILGAELSGVIAAVGKRVTQFRVGQAVFGMAGMRMGCHAEFCVLPASGALIPKPDKLSHTTAAALAFGGTTALDFFRRGRLKRGERLLVNGASGTVGAAAVQLAKHLGAHVTGVCSTGKLKLIESLGADVAIDYTKEDFTQHDATYDLIMDTVGTAPFSRIADVLRPGGRLLLVVAPLPAIMQGFLVRLRSDKRVIAGPARERTADLQVLAELARKGHFKPLIDSTYPLERAADAHAQVDTGHKRGSVVLALKEAGRDETI